MSFDPHQNLSYGLVDTAPSPALSGTNLTLQFGNGSYFPDPAGIGYEVTIWPADQVPTIQNAEIGRVTAKTGDAFTIVRAQGGTTAKAIAVGWAFALTITKKVVEDIEAAIPSVAGLLSAVNISAGATSNNLSALTFANGSGVSFGLTGSVITATVATNYQSSGAYLTTAALSQDSSKYAGTNGAITGGSITVNTAGVSVNLPAYLTTAMQSNAVTLSNIRVSAGTTSNLLSALTFSNSNGLAFGLDAGTITGSYTVPSAQTGISSLVASDATYTSGAVTFTGVGGGVTVKSNTGQRIDISVAAPVAQTVQTQNLVAVSLSGNTAGALALASSGTVIFAGGNNITLSQNGQSVTISGPNVGGAQTGISGIEAGTTTATSGTVSFADGNGITFGLDGQTLTATVRTNYVTAQTNQTVGLYASSNTTLTSSGTFDARSFSVRAIGSLTAGFSAGELLLSAPAALTTARRSTDAIGLNTAQTNVTWTVNSSGLSLDAGGYAGTNGAITGGSITVNTSGVSVNLPAYISTQSTQYLALTLGGNTSGTTTFHATNNASLFLNGGNNITLSGNGSTVTISAAAQTNQSIGLYASSNTYLTSSGTADARSLSFRGDKSITVGISASEVVFSVGAYITTGRASTDAVGLNTAQTNVTWTVNSSGISLNAGGYAGTGFTSTTTAGTDVKATNNTAGLSMAVPAFLTTALTSQSTQFLALTLGGNTAGTTTFHASNNASLFFNGGNNITLSGNGSTVTVIGPNTSAQQTGISGIIVSDASYTSGTVSFSNAGNITISSSVNGATQFIRLSGNAAQTNQSAIKGFGVSNTGQTAGNTGISTGIDWVLAGSGSITLSQSTAVGGPNTVWFQHPAWLTTAMASNRGSDFVQATAVFNGTNATGTIASGALSVSVAAPIPIATAVNPVASANSTGTVTRYAPEDHRHAGIGAVGISTAGNTAGTTGSVQGTYWIQGGANLTVSQITSNNGSHTLVLSAGSAAPSPVNFSAGTTSSDIGSVVFSNSNGISFGLSGSTITANADTVGTATTYYSVASANSVGTVTRWAAEDHRHAGVGGIGISTAGSTSGTTGSVLGTYWLQGTNDVTLSQITSNNGSHTLVISAGNALRNYAPYLQTNTAGFAPVAGSFYFVPFAAPGVMAGGRLNFLLINTSTAGIARDVTAASFASNTTGTKQQSFSYSLVAALYSQGTGANSTRLESVWSNSFSFGLSGKVQVSVTGGNNSVSVSNSWSISYIQDIGSDGAYTLSQFASASNSNATNTSLDVTALTTVGLSVRNMLSNSVVIPIGFNTTVPSGQYWLAIAWSSTTASAVTNFGGTGGASALMFSNLSVVGISQLELNSAFRNWGSTATTARSQIFPGAGAVYTGAAALAPPAAIALSSDLSSVASQWIPYFNIQYRGLTK